jgi:glycosidase
VRWPDYAVWWHVYPLGFLGAERAALPPGEPPSHRLPALADWLDYLLGLGCNGLALGPVFAAETHGYDTVDHFRVDPRLGTEEDLVHLVETAAARGVRVLLDGVFNHVGRTFPAFADVVRNGAASPYADWFVPESREAGGNETGVTYRTFEGHDHLVALNHDSPAVADHVASVLGYWLDRGVAGWRLDAAYQVPPAFWRTVTDRVRVRHPQAWFSGEVIHGDYASYVTEGGLDSVTQYELWKAIWSGLNDRNLYELAWALKRHNAMLDTFAPQTFVGNHDVTRLASRLTDPRHLPHALAVLFTVGGTPSVYAGDEQAFRGVKEDRAGGDDAVRPAFPATPADLAPFGQATYRMHQDLIGMRRRNPWLHRARTTPTTLANRNAVLESTDGEHRLHLALNLDALPVTLPTPGAAAVLAGAADLHDGQTTLAPHDWAVVGE